jgi:hypothetical protein
VHVIVFRQRLYHKQSANIQTGMSELMLLFYILIFMLIAGGIWFFDG